MNLTKDQRERYSRHIVLKEFGLEGQKKIMNAKILIIGMGGLGSAAALYLTAAGVGTIGIVDSDRVDLSNVQRQIIHFTDDVGVYKVESAARKMKAINPDVDVKTYREFVNSENILNLIENYDFIIDSTDNFQTKFLINDACFFLKKPFSHGGVLRYSGQTMTVIPSETACYRCVFESPPPKNLVPTCSQDGILNTIPGILGTIQATEALKFITNVGELLTNQLLILNAQNMNFRKIKFQKNINCPICGKNPRITKLLFSK